MTQQLRGEEPLPADPVDLGPDLDARPDAWMHGLRLAAASERFIAQLRASLGLSSNEMNALLLLHEDGACTMSELAGRIRISRAALSTLARRLERGGWVVLTPDRHDRR